MTKNSIRKKSKYSLIKSRHSLPKKCEICNKKSDIHHVSYKTPFLIIFLCREHHIKLHQLLRKINYDKTFIRFSKRNNISLEITSEIVYSLFFDPRFSSENNKQRYAEIEKHYKNIWNISLKRRGIKYLFVYYNSLKKYLLLRLRSKFGGTFCDFYRRKIKLLP